MDDSLTSLTLKRLYDTDYWVDDGKPQWLPRLARFEARIGEPLDLARPVWRTLELELSSGPEFLYRYFPFTTYIYVDGRAVVALEFDGPLESQTAAVPVPVGRTFSLQIVNELAASPASTGHGGDTRELALMLRRISLSGVAERPANATPEPVTQSSDLNITIAGERESEPVFVVGSYRSATSVLTWAIGQHPNIWPMEESGWIPLVALGTLASHKNATQAARGFFDVYDVDREEFFTHIGRSIDEFCQRVSRRHLHGIMLGRLSGKDTEFNHRFQLARTAMNPKRRWVDGTPEHSGYIMALRLLFPRSKFIGLVRNPLDVVASMLRFDRAGGAKTSVKEGAAMWLGMTRWVLLAYRAYGPSVVHLLLHKDLIDDPVKALAGIFQFLGEPDFPKAADTFSKRINSSKVDNEERSLLYAEIDAEESLKIEMLALYDDVVATLGDPWVADGEAMLSLNKAMNDWITRIVEAVG